MLAHKASRARTVWEINPALGSKREGASLAVFDFNVSAQFESRQQWNRMVLREQGVTQQPYLDYERWPEQTSTLGYVDWMVIDVDSQWTNKETEVLAAVIESLHDSFCALCELISLVRTLLLVSLSFCACANCEWNGMGACQDQALCVGCVDLHWKSA